MNEPSEYDLELVRDNLARSKYVLDNHIKEFNSHGPGIWMLISQNRKSIKNLVLDTPIYVPKESIPMFVDDLKLYRYADNTFFRNINCISIVVLCYYTHININIWRLSIDVSMGPKS